MSNIDFRYVKGENKINKEFDKLGGFNSVRALKICVSKKNNWLSHLKIQKYIIKKIKHQVKICRETNNSFEELEIFLRDWSREIKLQLKEEKNKRKSLIDNIISHKKGKIDD